MKRWLFFFLLTTLTPLGAPMASENFPIDLLVNWAEARERMIRSEGRPLTASETVLARRVGVKNPENVRVLGVSSISLPDAIFPAAISLNSPMNAAQTIAYGILVRTKNMQDQTILVHEFTHVAQYERLGGIQGFLPTYLQQIQSFGYDEAPLELEAARSESLVKRLNSSSN